MGIMDQLVGANDEQKKAALAALAQSGTAGLDAYNAGLQSVSDATSKAAATAAQRGAWMGGQASQELAGIASSTGDAARQALERAKAQYAADNQNRQGITSAYFDQMKAGVPLISAWTDSQAKLKGQAYEQELARQKEQQDWAREQHQMQMQMLQARAGGSGGGGGGRSTGPTAAQQKALAQAQASAEQRQQEQAAMQSRLDEMNRAAQLAYNAARATPNEMASDDRKYLTADRAERDANVTNSARSVLMPDINWNSGSLDEMAAAYDKIRQQAAAKPQYAFGPAFTQEQNGWNVDDTPVPLAGYSAFAQSAAPAQVASASQDARSAALARLLQMYQSADANASNFKANNVDPLEADTKSHMAAYQQALDNGSEPWIAALAGGSFDPAADVLGQFAKQRQASAKNDYFDRTGYMSPSAALSAQNAQTKLGNAQYDRSDVALANKLMTSPDQLEAKRGTDAYAQATNIVGQLIADAQQGGPLPTADVVRQQLMATGDPNILAVIPLVLAEMDQQGVLFSQGYSNQVANG